MELTSPGPTLGVVGGGQLGRMLGEAAAPLGVDLIVLDPTPGCPAAPVARDQIVAEFDDNEAIARLADRADAITLEIELANPDAMKQASAATGIPVHPNPETLRMIQDKLIQKERLAEAGIPVPEFRSVDNADDLRAAIEDLGPVMLKAREGGYDGRGNRPVQGLDEVESAIEVFGNNAMAEALLDFKRELSIIAVKGDDETAMFPVTETIHREEILRETITPARADSAVLTQARSVVEDVLAEMQGRGVYGVELFQDEDDQILVNEIAPRPHNSGHWTIEGATVSQFEQHVRAVLDLPLANIRLRSETAMANLLGDVEQDQPAALQGVETLLSADGCHLHWYGKREARPLRKLGHLTVAADGTDIDDPDALLARARELRDATTFRSNPPVS